MQSAIVLAGFTLVSIVLMYVLLSSTYQGQLNSSLILQKKLYRDADRLAEVAEGTYLKGWTTAIIQVRFNEIYNFKVGPNYITMSKYEEEITKTLPLNIIPSEFNASSVNVSYTVYNGTAAINISPS